ELLRRGDLVRAWIHRGYWIDIGTPEKYLQVHRDILRGAFPVRLDGEAREGGWVHRTAVVEPGAARAGPFYVGPGARVAKGAPLGPDAVLTASVAVKAGARVHDSVVWAGTEVDEEAVVEGALVGADVRIGRSARVAPGAVLGEGSVVSDHSRTA